MPSLSSAAASDAPGNARAFICGLDRRAAFVAFTDLCGTPRLSAQGQDRIDLDERSAWQRGNADCRTCRIRLREVLRHDFIDAREMCEVCEIHGELHGVIEPASRFIGDGLQIVEHAMDLCIDAVNKLHGRRIQSDLSGQIHRVATANRLRIRSDCLRCSGGIDGLLHGTSGWFDEGNCAIMKPATPEFNRIRQLLSSHRMNSDSIAKFERVLATGRDSALLRFSLGNEYLKLREIWVAIFHLKRALELDPNYSAAWKLLGLALTDAGVTNEALDIYRRGIEVARRRGDQQAQKEMSVFARRLEKKLSS